MTPSKNNSKSKTKKAPTKKKGGSKVQLVRDTVATLKTTRPDCANGVSRKLVATFCGYTSHTDSAFKVLISGLVKHKGHLIYCGADAIDLTVEGKKHASVTELKMENDAQIEQAKENAKGKAKTIVEMLSNGKTLSRARVAKELGYENHKASAFKVLVSGAVKAKSLEYCDDNEGNPALRLPDWCYPFGRTSAQEGSN